MYTFCSSHKQVVPTVETLQRSTASLLHRPLELDDLARIKAVCPDMIHWAYVSAMSLPDSATPPAKRRRQDEDLFALPRSHVNEYTMLFEFTDHGLHTGKATSRRYVAASKPKHTTSMALIQRRTDTFARALDDIVEAAHTAQLDPEQLLAEAVHAVYPTGPPESMPGVSSLIRPTARPTIAAMLASLPSLPWWRDQIVPGGRHTFAARPAMYSDVDPPLSSLIMDALDKAYRITSLYTHQALALTSFQRGQHVVVSTGTSSGKSLVYQIPMAMALADDEATALCIFPTKALTQDQLRSLQTFFSHFPPTHDVVVATYDGDTPMPQRKAIREQARVLFTNPDMLHQAILPHEMGWRRFFRGLRVVVLDELHIYAGVFGTHVAWILRRLRRLCHALGNDHIQFVSASATIAEPADHMARLVALPTTCIDVVDQDGSPCGQKEWVVWNSPLIDPRDPSHGRVSTFSEASQLFRHLLCQGIRTILFAKVRRTCEILVREIREDLLREGHAELAERVHGYRSGYSASDRRSLEQDMASGHTMGLIATSALELGVDIGGLDAVLLFGMPYSSASLWQQAGRAGRRQKDALVVVLGEPFSVDQYYMRHPELVFAKPSTALWLDLENELIMERHIHCAAFEMPLHDTDEPFLGARCLDVAKRVLEADQDGYLHCTHLTETPAHTIAIRGARQDTYKYVDATSGALLEEVEWERVYFEAYEGAVFLHQGQTYICQHVWHEQRIARMMRANVLYHTRPRDVTDIDARETWRIRTLPHASVYAYYGRVDVCVRVWGYFKVDRRANILDAVDIEAAPMVRPTVGLWIDVPWPIIEALSQRGIHAAAAIHAAEHAILSLTPMFIASMADDVRTECKVAKREYGRRPTQRKRPSRLIFYDKPGQDAGVCAQMFGHVDTLLQIALRVIEECGCTEGCPGCIETPTCLHDNDVSSKLGAMAVLRGLLQRDLFADWDEPRHEQGHAPSALSDDTMFSHTLCEPTPVPQRVDTIVEDITEPPAPSPAPSAYASTAPWGSSLAWEEEESTT